MTRYQSSSNVCCGESKDHALTRLADKLIDAHFSMCRYVANCALDCAEGILDCLCPKDCKSSNDCCGSVGSEITSKCCVDDMCCEIPEPCWMPNLIGEYCGEICDGGKIILTLWIANEDYVERTYRFSRRGDRIGHVSFSVNELTLKAKERSKVMVTFDAPAKPNHCETACYDLLIWIDSCRDYYLRWVIRTSHKPKPCCLELAVIDKPDYITHWYDHFYCAKPCHY